MGVTRIEMPTKFGRRIPNPYRYLCDKGHLHPSHRKAVECNRKHRLPRPTGGRPRPGSSTDTNR